MSQLDVVTQERASDVVRAVLAAQRTGDTQQVCFDIVSAAALVAGDDPATKSAVAWYMHKLATKLDADLTSATTLQ